MATIKPTPAASAKPALPPSDSVSPEAPTASSTLDTNTSFASVLEGLLDKKLAPLYSQIKNLQADITVFNSNRATPVSSPRTLPAFDDTGNPPNSPLKTNNTYTYLRAMGADVSQEPAAVPRIQSRTRLNSAGDFVEEDYDLSNTLSSVGSHRLENDIMDRRRGVSFREIGVDEKRDVFQLGAVRRSMRNLDYSELLLTKEALALSLKYMEVSTHTHAHTHTRTHTWHSTHPTNSPRSVRTVRPFSISVTTLCRATGRTPTTKQYAMRHATSLQSCY